ncbi:MAG: SusC/RagA family TonB-linked outer membrane protein [Saprospiraceae bacterium]
MKQVLFLMFILFGCVGMTFGQKVVSGKVTDNAGESIIGANITVKNVPGVGTISDIDGMYSLNVPAGSTVLVFSYTGYEKQEIAIGASDVLNVTMSEGKLLEEIVVTGTGVATGRKSLAFDVQALSASKLPVAPTADIGSALIGKIAGAQISSVNGTPGRPINIILRGVNSIRGGTLPMIILDGVQIASTGLESLDLNNVERVEVVSGPAAASLYGAQGANGVIQLFSKKGTKGRLNIDFSSNVAVNELLNVGNVNKAKKHPYVVNAAGEVVDGSGVPLVFDGETGSYLTNPVFNLISPTGIYNQDYGKNLQWYDHYKMFFQKATVLNNSLSVNGSSDKFNFSFVLSDNKQETVFKNNGDFRRTNVSANIGYEILKGLTFRSTTQLVNTTSTLLDPDGRNMLFAINNSRPFANFEAKDDAGLASPYYGDAVGVNHYNFNFIIENAKVKDKTLDIVQSFNLNYKFAKFVELDAKYGLNRSAQNVRYEIAEQSKSIGSEYWQYWAEYYSPRTSYGAPTTGSESGEINNSDYISTNQNLNANAFIRFNLEDDFGLNIPLTTSTQVGWDYRKTDYSQFRSYGTDAPGFTPYTAQNMANFQIASDYTEKFATYGYLINQRFDYADIAGVSAGFRSDYSSAFGQGSKPFTFPRGDAYVRLTNLGFLKGSKLNNVVDEWKLRAAYGEAGIQPGAYDRFPILTTAALGSQSAFSTPVTNKNADLQIEVSKELEFGTDLTLKLGSKEWFNNLNLGFTVWQRTSENIIDEVDVAPSLGIGKQLTNSMTLKSNGIQASLGLIVLASKDWEWDFTTNFNKQVSKVDKVLGGAELIKTSAAGSSGYIIRAGEQIGQIYGYLFLNDVNALDPKTGLPFIAADLQKNYEVASNGYVVDKASKQPYATPGKYSLGDPYPSFNTSFINQISYKRMVLFGFQWDWVNGSNIYNQTKQWMYRDGIHKDYDNPITIDGKTEAYSAFYRGSYAVRQANGTKSYFMEDASFVRLRNISIGFELAKIFDIKTINSLQLTFSGRNLVTFTKYTGMDPEVSSGTTNSSWDRAVDHNTIPNVKSYQIGIKISY